MVMVVVILRDCDVNDVDNDDDRKQKL